TDPTLAHDGPARPATSAGPIMFNHGTFTVSQTGISPSFAASGPITVAAGTALTVNAGTFNQSAGAVTVDGTLFAYGTALNLTGSWVARRAGVESGGRGQGF